MSLQQQQQQQQQQQEVYNNLKDESINYNMLKKKRNLMEDEYERKLLLHAQGHADTGQRAFRPHMEEYYIYRNSYNSYKPYEPYKP